LHNPFPSFGKKTGRFGAGKAKFLFVFVLANDSSMKTLPILLLPAVALLVSACASGPAGPVSGGGGPVYYGGTAYYDYGPGPSPRSGYYWNGSIYIQGENPYFHYRNYNNNNGYNGYDRKVTNVNDVNVNRTNVNDRTVNNTTVNDRTVNRTNVNQRNVNRTNINKRNVNAVNKRVTTQQPAHHKPLAKPTPNP
jgi:hypothetical protein